MQYLHLQLYCMQVISPVLKRPATKVDPGGKRVRGAPTSSTAVETAFRAAMRRFAAPGTNNYRRPLEEQQ
jgi:hypothetical protein